MRAVVLFEPALELSEDDRGVRARVAADVVALEGLHERLRHAVGLRTTNRREASRQAELVRESSVSAAV